MHCGANPAQASVHQFEAIKMGKKAYAKVLVVDPQKSETVKHLWVDLHVRPRPGTDCGLCVRYCSYEALTRECN